MHGLPTVADTKPTAHGVQAADADTDEEYPAWQDEQFTAPVILLTEPIAQGVHLESPVSFEKYP